MPSIIYSIYVYTLIGSNKRYVGATKQPPPRRDSFHCWAARAGRDQVFYRALRKYGRAAFSFETIYQTTDPVHAEEMEIHFIATLRSHVSQGGYNMSWGGEGCRRQFTPKERAQIAARMRATWQDPKYRERTTSSLANLWQDSQYRSKQKATRGTPEYLQRYAQARGGLWIIGFPDRTERVIKNLRRFCAEHQLNKSCMLDVANGKQRQHKGFYLSSCNRVKPILQI